MSPDPVPERPPVAILLVLSLAAVIASGVFLASFFPKQGPLLPPAILLCASGLLLLAAVYLLLGLKEFAWWRFRQVSGWVLLVYIVISGMLEFVIVLDGTRGGLLILFTASLAIFAVDIPLLLGFSVARYQPALRPTA